MRQAKKKRKKKGAKRMADIEALKATISDRGISIDVIAKDLEMDKSTFYRRLSKNGEEFTVREVAKLSEVLGLNAEASSEIFFKNIVA